jgi:hypothetical protein
MVCLAPAPVYTLKITLLGTDPPVWRRVALRGDVALEDLHWVVQLAMGWTNSHLHQFFVGKRRFGQPHPDYGDDRMDDEADFTLTEVAPRKGAKLRYEYDFGDSWMHEIAVEKIDKAAADHKHPVCTDGERNCPPEDVGGIWGYSELVEAMAKPKHPRREEFLDWLGEPFNPEALDLAGINKQLKHLKYTH